VSAVWAPGVKGPDQPITSRIATTGWVGPRTTRIPIAILRNRSWGCAPHLPYAFFTQRPFPAPGGALPGLSGIRHSSTWFGYSHGPQRARIAQALDPACRSSYLDIDPVFFEEDRHLLAARHFRLPARPIFVFPLILADASYGQLLSLGEPVACPHRWDVCTSCGIG